MLYFIARGREKVGPMTLDDLRRLAVTGQLRPADMLLPEGAQKWQQAGTVVGLAFDAVTMTGPVIDTSVVPASHPAKPAITPDEPLPASQPGTSGTATSWLARLRKWVAGPDSRPWNPLVLFGLGLLFGVPWLAVCSSINSLRLSLPSPWWRPLLVGGAVLAGLLLIGVVSGLAGGSWLVFFLVQLPAFVGAWAAFWYFDTRHQLAAFRGWAASGRPSGAWWKPAVAGVALVGVFWALDWSLRPMAPREVCERFNNALHRRDLARMKRHAHPRLRHAIDAVPQLEGEKDASANLDLIGPGNEGWSEEAKCYLVPFTRTFKLRGSREELSGAFALTLREGRWVVAEVYYWVADQHGDPLTVTLSSAYPEWQKAAGVPRQDLAVAPTPSGSADLLTSAKTTVEVTKTGIELGQGAWSLGKELRGDWLARSKARSSTGSSLTTTPNRPSRIAGSVPTFKRWK